jgi:hypothetical protein
MIQAVCYLPGKGNQIFDFESLLIVLKIELKLETVTSQITYINELLLVCSYKLQQIFVGAVFQN